MHSIPLGKTGLRIPAIGFATWNYTAGPAPLLRAIELGAAHVSLVGQPDVETMVGGALRDIRDRVFLSARIAPPRWRYEDILRAVDDMLGRLQTDRIELGTVGDLPDDAATFADVFGALESLVDAGKLGHIGVTSLEADALPRALAATPRHGIVACQAAYNLINRDIESGLIAYAQAHGITIVGTTPLAGSVGQLIALDRAGALQTVAAATGRTPAQVALAWCLARPGLATIVSARSVAHVEENCAAADLALSAAEMAALERYERRGTMSRIARRSGGTNVVDSVNRATMQQTVDEYSTRTDLTQSEASALLSVVDLVRGKRILDLGVGGGRTVPSLLTLSTNYLGVDYVQEMVDQCRARFPNQHFEHADARAMPQFADQSFDLIVFACNGVCMVDHAGRLAILREVRRLLSPDGVFVFSTYNRANISHDEGFVFPAFRRASMVKLPASTARFLLDTSLRLKNRARYTRYEVRTEEYSIINDRSHHFSTLLYYIPLDGQLRQLQETGFTSTVRMYDVGGREVDTTCVDRTVTFVVHA